MRLGTSRSTHRRVASVAAGAVAVGGLAALPALPASGATTACTVKYAATNSGKTFTANLTVRNTSGEDWKRWVLKWKYNDGQTVTSATDAKVTQAGKVVTAKNTTDNGAVKNNRAVKFSIKGKFTTTNSLPTAFKVNGKECTGGGKPPTTKKTTGGNTGGGGKYKKAFLALYKKLHDPSNGYFSKQGIPYHSIEQLVIEAPDWGHETTSEAFSYYMWLEAEYGRLTGDWKGFNTAWDTAEKYIIPTNGTSNTLYPTKSYDPTKPATYAAEHDLPQDYPSPIESSVPVGADPLYAELKSTYGTNDVYGMHWIIDVDNDYGYGECGDGTTAPSYINTFQRGAQESVWETVTHPSCETFDFGAGAAGGFTQLFIKDSAPAKQWRFTDAPDADARAVQVTYWALEAAKKQGKQGAISASVEKATKMGDYLRYAMYDKYFKVQGCESLTCPGGTGKDSAAYLLSWYYAWGGALDGTWSWRISASHNHGGYQNPMAAWVLTQPGMTPESPTAKEDWGTSLKRQIEFYTWLQSSEGAIAGGATNSWGGQYAAPPSSLPKFYGMAYDWQPVYHDPPSNQWFGFQAWSMERVAEYAYVSKDKAAMAVMAKWAKWAMSETTISGSTYKFPSTLTWKGQPGGNWDATKQSVDNSGLHVTVEDYSDDIGVAGSYAKALAYYAKASGDTKAKAMAQGLLDGILTHADSKGFSVPETRKDYKRLDDTATNAGENGALYIPSGFSGTMANGDVIKPGVSHLDIRSFYKDDPEWPKVQKYLDSGNEKDAPVFTFHRFWAQVDIATAFSVYDNLF